MFARKWSARTLALIASGIGVVLILAVLGLRTKSVPVVIMTSSREEPDIDTCYQLGANSYVVKPVDFSAFADIARQAGFYWLAINRTP